MSYLDKTKLTDIYGNEVESTILGQLRVTNEVRLAGGIFNGGVLDPNFFSNTNSNGGTSIVTNNELALTLTTASNSSANVQSNSVARFIGNESNYFRGTFRITDSGAVNNIRQWGPFLGTVTPTDGYFYQLSGTTFSVGYSIGGALTVVNNGSFNGTSNTYVLDANYHTYEVYYTEGVVLFTIDEVVIHKFEGGTTAFSNTIHLKPNIININTGVGSAVTIRSLLLTISRLGELKTQQKTAYLTTGTTTLKTIIGSLHVLIFSGIASGATVTLYDNTSGTAPILWASGAMTLGSQANNFPFSLDFGNYQFATGLTVVITGTVSLTCIYE